MEYATYLLNYEGSLVAFKDTIENPEPLMEAGFIEQHPHHPNVYYQIDVVVRGKNVTRDELIALDKKITAAAQAKVKSEAESRLKEMEKMVGLHG